VSVLAKKPAKIGFLFSLALKNILHHKKHMFMLIFGFSITVSILLAINTWAVTAKDLAVTDFLEKQDFQAYMFSSQNPEDINLVQESLTTNPLVSLYTTAYTSYALFNFENKSPSYVCLPEEEQNGTDPVSVTNVFIANQTTLEQMSFMFNVEGSFTLANNTILVSLQQAQEMAKVYQKEITVGTIVNISIAKKIPNPAYGQNRLESFLSTNYENFTIGGIYTVREVVSVIETAVKVDWLADSVIFPLAQLNASDREIMALNDIPYLLFIKFNQKALIRNGFESIIDTMTLFSEQIKRDYPAMFIYLFTSPIETLLAAYARAAHSLVFILPVLVVSSIVMVFTTNITIKAREKEVALLRDRGADTFQIIFLFILEFILATFIGLVCGIALSFPLAAIIPALAKGGFTMITFVKFWTNFKISYSFFSGTIILLGLGLISYASFKVWWEMSLQQSQSGFRQYSRKKVGKNILLGLLVSITAIVAIALLFSLIKIIPIIREEQSFSVANSATAGYTFTLFTILLVAVAFFVSLLLTEILYTRMKWFYRRLLLAKAFFLSNNLRRKSKRLSQITFAILVATAVLTFSMITINSIAQQQETEVAFKNGADLRIMTYPLDYSFKDNISRIEEINEVLPVFKTKGSIAYSDYTIYGLDPTIYSRVGNWDESSFLEGETAFESLYALEETADGVIISNRLAERLNLSVGDNLPINNLPGGIYSRRFTIVGLINSAPGLGLAEGRNLEMLQPYEGFVIINGNYCRTELGVMTSQLFLASVYPGENIQKAAEKVTALLPNIEVNPKQLNEEFIGAFITNYIPKAQVFFKIANGIIIIITIILLVAFTDFTLKQRTKEMAIKLALGISRRELTREVMIEIAIITIGAAISGIITGILFSYGMFYLIIPLITAQSIIPYTILISGAQLALLLGMELLITLLGVMPTMRKYRKEKIIKILGTE